MQTLSRHAVHAGRVLTALAQPDRMHGEALAVLVLDDQLCGGADRQLSRHDLTAHEKPRR
jgi:hypothetical protein